MTITDGVGGAPATVNGNLNMHMNVNINNDTSPVPTALDSDSDDARSRSRSPRLPSLILPIEGAPDSLVPRARNLLVRSSGRDAIGRPSPILPIEEAPGSLVSQPRNLLVRSSGRDAIGRLCAVPMSVPVLAGCAQTRSRSAVLAKKWCLDTVGRVSVSLPPAGVDAYQHCRDLISRSNRAFYIGITEDPMTRWRGNGDVAGHCHLYEKFIVCFESHSSASTAALERRLIGHFTANERDRGIFSCLFGNIRCLNSGSGGERASAGSPHYLYVAFRANQLIRRSR